MGKSNKQTESNKHIFCIFDNDESAPEKLQGIYENVGQIIWLIVRRD